MNGETYECEGHCIHGRKCTRNTSQWREIVMAKELDKVAGYTREITPLIRKRPICDACAAQGIVHPPFEFMVGFFDAATECTHANAKPAPKVGARVSSYCKECGAVFRIGNGTGIGADIPELDDDPPALDAPKQ